MLTALWHLGGWWQLRRLRRVGVREAPEEAQRLLAGLLQRFALRHAVKLVVSVEVAVPTLLGWLRPLVILPAAVLAELPPRQLEMILAHEWLTSAAATTSGTWSDGHRDAVVLSSGGAAGCA